MANTYISRTFGTPTNSAIWTLSFWIKRSSISGTQKFFSAGTGSTDRTEMYFASGGNISIYKNLSGSTAGLNSTRLFRDTNAWYHFVIQNNNGTATVYCNNETVSLSSTSLGTNKINLASTIHIFGDSVASGENFDGIMSHIHFVDGTIYAPTVFGSTDSTTGEWQINTSPSITMGNNGFTILKDGNAITDQSSNSNNFSASSGTLTKTEDCPSNVFATLNGAFNLSDNVLSYGNNKVVNASSNWKYVPATLGASSGKWYAEYKNTIGSGYLMVGVVDMQYAVSQDQNSYTHSGAGTGSVSIYDNGEKYIQGSNTTYAASYGSGSIIGVALDMDNGKVYFSKDGAWSTGSGAWGSSTFDSAVGAITLPTTGTYTFALSQRSGAYNETNFGNGYFGTTAVSSAGTNASGIGIFEYDVPTGYTALSTKGLNL